MTYGDPPMSTTESARVASNGRWSAPGARARASAIQRAAQRRYAERAVDPDGVMSPDELDAAVRNYYRARMARVRSAGRAAS